jgi:GNAT superfamily N-acetyltransferase
MSNPGRIVSMEIMKALSAEDAPEISRVYARSWKAAYRGIVPQEYLDTLPEDKWTAVLTESGWQSYSLKLDGEYAGTASVCHAREEAMSGWGELVSIYLVPEYFGKGLGGPLLEAAIAGLREMGFGFIYLWVLEENARARRFYEKHGFALTPDRYTVNIGGKNLIEVRYIKYLS